MEIIRHAAKAHGGLGWCIYDHKFRHKAAASPTLSWANIDMQLWLRIFTASSTQLREDYSLFSNGPSNKAGAARDAICHLKGVYKSLKDLNYRKIERAED